MREVAKIVTTFPDELPCLVLSAMGPSTNLLLSAGKAAIECDPADVTMIQELRDLRELHLATMNELEIDGKTRQEVEKLLQQLQQLLTGIALMQELTARTKDNLVSFGERMSTRIFASYLRKQGVKAVQYDSFRIGFSSTDDFGNGDILASTYDDVRDYIWQNNSEETIPVVTGFLARGAESGAITTLGRGGSDLSATVLGRALEVKEVTVWKDVDGVLSADPRIVDSTVAMPIITFEEATELAYFGAQVLHPQAMQPCMGDDTTVVRVKNSYNPASPGTVIRRSRSMEDSLLTSIVVKKNVTLLDIVSTRMLGQYGFLARVFDILLKNEISVDVVATSEVSVSLTMDPAKIWSRELMPMELKNLQDDFSEIANVSVTQGHSIISLIANVERSTTILERAFGALADEDIKVTMISQGASKVNISLLISDEDAERGVTALHRAFFAASASGEHASEAEEAVAA